MNKDIKIYLDLVTEYAKMPKDKRYISSKDQEIISKLWDGFTEEEKLYIDEETTRILMWFNQ